MRKIYNLFFIFVYYFTQTKFSISRKTKQEKNEQFKRTDVPFVHKCITNA